MPSNVAAQAVKVGTRMLRRPQRPAQPRPKAPSSRCGRPGSSTSRPSRTREPPAAAGPAQQAAGERQSHHLTWVNTARGRALGGNVERCRAANKRPIACMRPADSGLFKEVFVNTFYYIRLLILCADIVANHQGAQRSAVDQHDSGGHPVCIRDGVRSESIMTNPFQIPASHRLRTRRRHRPPRGRPAHRHDQQRSSR